MCRLAVLQWVGFRTASLIVGNEEVDFGTRTDCEVLRASARERAPIAVSAYRESCSIAVCAANLVSVPRCVPQRATIDRVYH